MTNSRPSPPGVEDHAPQEKLPERQAPGDGVESQPPFRRIPETY
jgi:hypothetical protein